MGTDDQSSILVRYSNFCKQLITSLFLSRYIVFLNDANRTPVASHFLFPLEVFLVVIRHQSFDHLFQKLQHLGRRSLSLGNFKG